MASSDGGPPAWVWLVWLASAVCVAVVGLLRPTRPADDAMPADDPLDAARGHKALQRVPLLAVTGLVSFCAWVATQIIYMSVRHPKLPAIGGPAVWPPADLARLSLISALVGWLVGFGLLVYGRGVATVGLGVRRFPSGVLAGAIGIFVALPVVYFTLEGTMSLWAALHVEHPSRHELLRVMEDDPRSWVRLTAMVSAAVVAPLFEELLFRGCVQGGLRRATNSPSLAIGAASLLFTVIHPAWTMPPIFVFSVLLGVVYDRTRNLWATTVMHALFNAFAIWNGGAT